MQQFVIIFRQKPGQLTEADLANRANETRPWAQEHNAAGHQLVPRILGAESRWCAPDGRSGPAPALDDGPVTAFLFLEARDFDQAADIARSHPAVRYGASVEVRSWAAPQAQA